MRRFDSRLSGGRVQSFGTEEAANTSSEWSHVRLGELCAIYRRLAASRPHYCKFGFKACAASTDGGVESNP